ncbi:isoamylase early set domain-containing protein [Aliifodinibius sp. S!AR15-10]|uniref:isoamylase early set domain-containing protein n=1 Tax=Aliifodinibius sp. S!AR15-10 TaxID=2950437 RepID=UPI002859F173|nr:isoamylase early set domain-containing protein [Aliifodinibius sp. S!AR15-10]MDR8390301.1 isoamylase early set domain-containing protein [Aliifodinibius sp. S!AR15-10]
MNNEKETLLRKYLDGELSAEEEQKALHLFADDEELRSMLRFEMKLQQSFRGEQELSSFEVPAGFSDRVMNQITENATADAESKNKNRQEILDWFDWLWRPQAIQWRPAYGMIILLLIVSVILALPGNPAEQDSQQATLDQSVQTVSEANDEVMLRFVFMDDQASSVAVAGDFNNWEPEPLTREVVDGRQVWTGLVSMSRGEHRYMFVKDGKQWVTDPLAPMYREDGFGNKNAVIYL